MRHLPRAYALAAILLAAACSGGDPTGPTSEAGVYRLASVDGHPLPHLVSSVGGSLVLATHGDLLLRADGSFALGLRDGVFGVLSPGHWRRAGSELRLIFPTDQAGGADTELQAVVAGDSITLTADHRYVFRRAVRSEPPVSSGTYVLTSMNGRTDLAAESMLAEYHRVKRVLFDSITFTDGLFFRRHRSERTVLFFAPGDSGVSGAEWITHGSYDGGDGVLVLRDYAPWRGHKAVDSVAVAPGSLVRRSRAWNDTTDEEFIWEDVYTRRP